MEFTNIHQLPPEIVKVLTRERYNTEGVSLGDYSVTTLCAPIQQTVLKRRYADQLKVSDVCDNFWAFVGSIAHKVLEEHGSDDALIEKRLYAQMLGNTISGQVDHYKSGIITDYKSTKSYKIIKGKFDDWENQLNVYAWLAAQNDLKVDKIRIFTFILDWCKHKAYEKGYPKCPIVEIDLPLWDKQKAGDFVHLQLTVLTANELREDKELAPCSPHEMWQDVKDWAIIKNGSERATKCFDTEEEAVACFEEKYELATHYVEKRMTKRTRCFDHCPVSIHCHQHKALCEQEGIIETVF